MFVLLLVATPQSPSYSQRYYQSTLIDIFKETKSWEELQCLGFTSQQRFTLKLACYNCLLTFMAPEEHTGQVIHPRLQLINEVWTVVRIAASTQQRIRSVPHQIVLQCPRNLTIYEWAKQAQTEERDLDKALRLYGESARLRQRIDSCIKDVASIMHQMGQTQQGLIFLREMKGYYAGDTRPYQNLMNTLCNQLNPSIKHKCTAIALELPYIASEGQKIVDNLFGNSSRVRRVCLHSHMGFDQPSEQVGRWLVLGFKSYSGAKKTIQTFKEVEWFGVRKYWLKDMRIICEAMVPNKDQNLGWEDFDREVLVQEDAVLKRNSQNNRQEDFHQIKNLHVYNTLAVGHLWDLIEEKTDRVFPNLKKLADQQGYPSPKPKPK